MPNAAHLEWQNATLVETRTETPTAKTLRLRVPEPARFRAGQHYTLRLTAEDGYTATRSYSVASAPDDTNELEFTVERLEGGEVSTFLHDGLEVGDTLDIRGPIGGWFVWDGTSRALLIGGGSGVVPLMSMLRLARKQGNADLLRLVVSVRTPTDLFYAEEIAGPQTNVVYTRVAPADATRPPGHLATSDLPASYLDTTSFVCGSPAFSDAASRVLMDLGVPVNAIRIERFGPSG
jgi:ferredoxin-NADP reductase